MPGSRCSATISQWRNMFSMWTADGRHVVQNPDPRTETWISYSDTSNIGETDSVQHSDTEQLVTSSARGMPGGCGVVNSARVRNIFFIEA